MADTDVFKHSTPSLYDRFMGPLLFDPYAKYVAERVALAQPRRILETAAGTGIVTRAITKAVPEATIVATDINPAVVDFAAEHLQSPRVTFQQADAQDLPFADATFDLVLCLFGVMFFPDKVRASAEFPARFGSIGSTGFGGKNVVPVTLTGARHVDGSVTSSCHRGA